MHLTRSEYVAAMRKLETLRNEALRYGDRFALAVIRLRQADLDRVFWGRVLRTA